MAATRVCLVLLTFAIATPSWAATFVEVAGVVSMEAESYTSSSRYDTHANNAASGGYVMQIQENTADRSGALDFQITLSTGGLWYIWIRHYAPDHRNNGLYLKLNGTYLVAPAGHRYAGRRDIYLKKARWDWRPEWQGPHSGEHEGPITMNVGAGTHTLTVVGRKGERPLLDKIVLTTEASPAFVSNGSNLGPAETRTGSELPPTEPDPTDPTDPDPTDPTDPDPTDPDPTHPTDPDPTDPTDPDPTDPTDPDPTDPTDPDATDPADPDPADPTDPDPTDPADPDPADPTDPDPTDPTDPDPTDSTDPADLDTAMYGGCDTMFGETRVSGSLAFILLLFALLAVARSRSVRREIAHPGRQLTRRL